MIRYLTYSEVDKAKWDDCIRLSFNGNIYAYSWYLDIFAEGWAALIENDYTAVMPLTARKKWGFNYLFQPFFIQQLGVFSTDKLSPDKVNQFIQHIPNKYRYIEINLNTFNTCNLADFEITNFLTHELDLISTHEAIFRNYSENTKRNVRKAVDAGLRVDYNVSPEKIIELFRNNRGRGISSYSENDYVNLLRLIKMCMQFKVGLSIGVLDEKNELCAGAFFVEQNNKVIFLFSGSNEKAKSTGAMAFLIDDFIKNNAQRNLTLDFEGSNDKNLARFYKSFGSKECVYLHVRKNNLPKLIRWLKK